MNRPRGAVGVARPLRVAVDCRLMHYRKAGIAQYTRSLVQSLRAAGAGDSLAAELCVIVDRRDRDVGWVPPGVRVNRVFTPAHHRLEHLTLPLELARLAPGFDVLHSPDFIAPRGRFRKVITVHDLYFLVNPQVMIGGGGRYYGRIHESARRADRIIAVSDFTRREILRLLPGVDDSRIVTIHEAAHPLGAADPDARVPSFPYALFVGTFEPRKNLITLLRALHELREVQPEVRLVIVGERGWGPTRPGDVARELGLGKRVTFAGRVSDAVLEAFYRNARLVVLPSLSEGFGLPALEAMAHGVPVVCSNAGALPEVVGDAALMHDPLDVAGLARLIRMVWTIEPIRGDYGRRGLQRALDFSWDKTAQQTWRAYASAQAQ